MKYLVMTPKQVTAYINGVERQIPGAEGGGPEELTDQQVAALRAEGKVVVLVPEEPAQ
ncbi:MAG TPA: hypothetical protein PLV42_06970 [bacterium]|nr:hypothetical protein [bacterium]